jgi:septal ring factor EnvC (AmiA/AmiB activator)
MISFYNNLCTKGISSHPLIRFIFCCFLILTQHQNVFSQNTTFLENTQLPKKVMSSDPVGILFNDGPRIVYAKDPSADPIEILFWDRERRFHTSNIKDGETQNITVSNKSDRQEASNSSALNNKNSAEQKEAGLSDQGQNLEINQTSRLQMREDKSSSDKLAIDKQISIARSNTIGISKWPVPVSPKNLYGGLDPQGQPWKGLVFEVPLNTPVTAIKPGKVLFADNFKNYGNLIIVGHGERLVSIYSNNQKIIKKEGDLIKQGEVIALSGDVGYLNYPALYFEIRQDGKAIDPIPFFQKI